jgi:endonuclease/exonuclease/phosphatase family metal-dependent hydrolase
MSLEILSWNILSGGFKGYGTPDARPDRIDGIASAINQIKPDILSLVDTHRWTEVFSLDQLRQIFGYPHVYSVNLDDQRLIAKGHDNGITVFSKAEAQMNPIRLATRNAIQVKVGGVDIFCVYLDDDNEDTRLAQVRAILKLVNLGTPTIITGDLNTFDASDLATTNSDLEELARKYPGPMQSLANPLNEMRRGEVTKLLAQAGFVDLGKGRGATVPAKLFPLPTDGPILRLDYAFANSLAVPENFRVLTTEPYASLSDHYPISMRVSRL